MRRGYGFKVEATPFDELRVVIPVRLVGATFSGSTIDNNFWTVTTGSVSGSAIQSNNQIILTTGSAINGSCALQSTRNGRYVGGSANRYRAQIRLNDLGSANNIRRWGIFDGSDGAYFKLSGSTLFVCTMKGGFETAVESSLWNGNTTVPNLVSVTTYEIYPTNAKVYFVISGTMVHTASFMTDTWSNTSNLNVRMDTTNSGSSVSQNNIECRVATIYRLGNETTVPTYKHISGASTNILKYAPGTLHKITINTPGTLCTVYDGVSASGNVIGIVDTSKATGNTGTLTYDCPFFVGLTVVTTGASSDLSIIYE